MLAQLRAAAALLIAFTLLCGGAYPLVVLGFAQLVVPGSANGSAVRIGDVVVGSEFVAQGFAAARYFHPRPSAAGTDGFDATSSGGSNLGAISAKLVDRVRAAVEAHGAGRPVPADAVTTSGSGLDPEISPANALAQAARVAAARGRPESEIRALVERFTLGRELGILGERRVNVLRLNLELDAARAR
ncbi:MAG: potassium-transporting ATPase subunit KdpC [Alphaproteobacteria bacterium]|nr:potassium-transporting ATPase subunit KdpC [Alphaproteobacteria bacterium]